VAFSGGADSVALLAALAELRDAGRRPQLNVRAMHVDHGIHPESHSWARTARRIARRLEVPFAVRALKVVAEAGESLEAAARDARYAALAHSLKAGECLVTAHHEDDQAETLLLQLLRGAGVAGLAAMPACLPLDRGVLIRPLLGVPRSALRAWLHTRDLPWVEDPSNDDLRFDRNFLRQAVLPPLARRWPSAARVMARTAAHLAEARALLAEIADADLSVVQEGAALSVALLQRLSAARQRNVVRRWLERQRLALPDRTRLERILRELCEAREDSLPVVAWRDAHVRRWRGQLHAMAGPSPAPGPAPASLAWRLATTPKLALPAGLGSLRWVADSRGPFARQALPAVLRVSFRAGGERLRTEAGGPNRRLKELLRAGNVLPWMRDRIPLIHAGTELLAVANLWVNVDCASAIGCGPAGSRRRVRLEWCDAPAVKSCAAVGFD